MQNKKTLISWALYDFANSVFSTLVITFIYATYFTKSIATDEISGTIFWSRAISFSMFIVAILSPILGAIVDSHGKRKELLLFCSVICIISTSFLYFPKEGDVLFAMTLLIIANTAYELAHVFYNAYLPEIAPKEKIGRISGYAWSVGYVGGLLAMLIAMLVFIYPETPWFGLSLENGENIRATNIFVACWFFIFSIPMFVFVKDQKPQSTNTRLSIFKTISRIKLTWKNLKNFKQIFIFLVARLFYNDGLITIFSFGAIYAAVTFNFSFQEVMIFGIVLNVAAGIGAFAMGFFDDKWGGKLTINISLVFLIIATLIAIFTHSKNIFWFSGVLVGLCSGPNQSASRTLLSRFCPKEKINEFFGFFALSGKLTAFLGPLLLGIITDAYKSQRAGIVSILVLFIIGMIILAFVDEKKGIEDKGRFDT